MNFFGAMYDKTIQWSKHRYAVYSLSFVSFIEAIFFPIPPDTMLIPMSLSRPQKAIRYALIAGLFSALGGIIGYAIGFYAYDLIRGYIVDLGYQAKWDTAMHWFDQWGVLVVIVAGFSPIPYKVFTICAGVMQMAFFPFVIAAWLSRTARFLLVAKLVAWGGPKIEAKLRRYIEIIGWAVVALVVVAYLIYR